MQGRQTLALGAEAISMFQHCTRNDDRTLLQSQDTGGWPVAAAPHRFAIAQSLRKSCQRAGIRRRPAA